jgi:hypothetical protein
MPNPRTVNRMKCTDGRIASCRINSLPCCLKAVCVCNGRPQEILTSSTGSNTASYVQQLHSVASLSSKCLRVCVSVCALEHPHCTISMYEACAWILPLQLNSSTAPCLPPIQSAVCLTTGPQPLPRPVLHSAQSSASSFHLQYPLFSLRSSSSCLRFLPRLPVTSVLLSFLSVWNIADYV